MMNRLTLTTNTDAYARGWPCTDHILSAILPPMGVGRLGPQPIRDSEGHLGSPELLADGAYWRAKLTVTISTSNGPPAVPTKRADPRDLVRFPKESPTSRGSRATDNRTTLACCSP